MENPNCGGRGPSPVPGSYVHNASPLNGSSAATAEKAVRTNKRPPTISGVTLKPSGTLRSRPRLPT